MKANDERRTANGDWRLARLLRGLPGPPLVRLLRRPPTVAALCLCLCLSRLPQGPAAQT